MDRQQNKAPQTPWTEFYMICYRLMQTEQVCDQCGSIHLGSVASEPFVISQHKDYATNGWKLTIPVSELVRRYMMLLGIGEGAARQYLPRLPRVVVHTQVHVKQCASCFKGFSPEPIKNLPRTLPDAIPEVFGPIEGGNCVSPETEAKQADNENKRRRKKSLSIHPKGERKQTPDHKPSISSLFDLLNQSRRSN